MQVPFFLGLNHVNSLRAKSDEDVKLLVLDREDNGGFLLRLRVARRWISGRCCKGNGMQLGAIGRSSLSGLSVVCCCVWRMCAQTS